MKTPRDSINQQRIKFIFAATVIATVFLMAIVGVLTGRLSVPSADITPQTTSPERDCRGSVAKLTAGQFKTSFGNNTVRTVAIPNLSVRYDPAIYLTGSLQALKSASAIKGGFSVTRGGDPNNQLVSHIRWNSSTDGTGTINIKVDNNVLLCKLDPAGSSTATNYDVVIKPDHYLATKIADISTFDNVNAISFPPPLAGDFDSARDINDIEVGNNVIDEGDIAAWVSDLDKPVTGANGYKDLNRNGTIGFDDIAILIANLGKQGEKY